MIRLTYTLLFILALPFFTLAQINHVPNGDFEYYTQCPSSYSQTNFCNGWNVFVNAPTPDYFNVCSSGGSPVSVPLNGFGYQQAASGNGYMGGYFYLGTVTWREIICTQITPLAIGATYEVSLSVSLANNSRYAADNLSILFYDTIGTVTQSNILSIVPQINFQNLGPITDTSNWVRLVTSFTADSTYDNIAIGGFFPITSIDLDTLSGGASNSSYYYIDSVVVKPINNIVSIGGYSDTGLCLNDSFEVYYNSIYTLGLLNYVTVQLSDASGSFSNPIDIGGIYSRGTDTITAVIPNGIALGTGYKIRLLTSVPADTVLDTFTTFNIGSMDSVNIQVGSNSPVCSGGTLSFTNTAVNPNITYSWTGPFGFNSTLKTPSIYNITNLNIGSYYITSSYYGCWQRDTLNVTVKPLPNKPVASGNTPICEYDSLQLSSSSTTTGVTYSWTGPGGFTSSTNDTTIISTPVTGNGIYISAATIDGCSSYDTVNVTVNDAPDSVHISYNMPCSGDTLKLISDTSSGTVSYSWAGPNNFSVNTQNIFIHNSNVNHTGWYIMTATIGSCSYTDSVYAVVNQTPTTPTITYNTPICVSETLNLNAIGNSSTFYSWTGANSFSASGKTATRTNLQLADSGVYTVTASQNGCTASASAHIGINPTPFVNILSVDSICDGETVTFSALPSNAGANPQYNWFVNTQQVALGQTYTTTSLNNNDVIYCEMTDNTKCSSPYTDQSNTITMTVLPWLAPSVSITSNPTGLLQPWQYVTFTANPANAGSSPQYQWKRNGQDIVGATGSTWSANNLNDNDSISVELVSDYKCPQPATAMSNGIVVSVAVGVNDVNTLNNISLIPNPNNGQLILKGNVVKNGVANITIINTLGQIVYRSESNITDQTINERINLNDVASGLYLLRLDINGQRANIKFRVE